MAVDGGITVTVRVDTTTGDFVADDSEQLTADTAFDLLSNARRRYVLCYLQNRGEATVRALSRYTAAWENDIDPAAVSAQQRKRAYTALHQTHLPRLDEYGVIEYDRDGGRVEPAPRLALFEEYLTPPDDDGPEWQRYYLGIGLAATVLAAGIILGAPVLETVQPGVAAFAVGTAVLAGAAVHTYHLAKRVSPSFPDLRPSTESLDPDAATPIADD
ncbi:MAG: hypothetical protein ABEH64_08265 [Salinirussus sp.]